MHYCSPRLGLEGSVWELVLIRSLKLDAHVGVFEMTRTDTMSLSSEREKIFIEKRIMKLKELAVTWGGVWQLEVLIRSHSHTGVRFGFLSLPQDPYMEEASEKQ
jgi:hypothetical protein